MGGNAQLKRWRSNSRDLWTRQLYSFFSYLLVVVEIKKSRRPLAVSMTRNQFVVGLGLLNHFALVDAAILIHYFFSLLFFCLFFMFPFFLFINKTTRWKRWSWWRHKRTRPSSWVLIALPRTAAAASGRQSPPSAVKCSGWACDAQLMMHQTQQHCRQMKSLLPPPPPPSSYQQVPWLLS